MDAINIECFDLGKTLECGQFFRYEKQGPWYYVNSGKTLFKIRQRSDTLEFEGVDAGFVTKFFSLDRNLEKIYKSISKDNFIQQAIEQNRGVRVIRQQPFECLISYVCSAASNIPKIRMNMNLLAELFGRPVEIDGYKSFTFPEPGRITCHKRTKAAKAGFRTCYICDINRILEDDFFDRLRQMDYEKARDELTKLPGVGPKIADCVLLYSLGFDEAFPVDVWIERVLKKHYGPKGDLAEWARRYFGECAGYAQLYLYMQGRNPF